MQIDLLTSADLPAALRLSTAAGWNQVDQDWRRLIELYPASCFAGRVDGQLVATATLATHGRQLAWVGMVLVDPDHRRRGHATTMMRHVLEHARRTDVLTLGLDASDDGRPLYLKLGFRDAAPIGRFRRESAPQTAQPRAAREATEDDLDDLVSLDRKATGFDRSTLLRHMSREPDVRVFATGADRLHGYCFRRPGRTAWHLGPMAAESPAAFDGLLRAAIPGDAPVIADAFDPGARALLDLHGFRLTRTLTRMYLPAVEAPRDGPPNLPAAFELG